MKNISEFAEQQVIHARRIQLVTSSNAPAERPGAITKDSKHD